MSMQKRLLGTLLLLSISVHAVMAGTATAPEPMISGQVLFNAVGCWECHGYSGQGTLSGPQIATSVLPLPVFQRLLRHPARLMPAYGADVLSDQQVASIYGYLQSLAPPRHAKELPLLQP